MSEQRLQISADASINVLVRRLNMIYREKVAKPISNMQMDEITNFITNRLPPVVRMLTDVVDFHLTKLLRLELFEGRATPMTQNEERALLEKFKENSRYNKAFDDFQRRISAKLLSGAFDNFQDPEGFSSQLEQVGRSEFSSMSRIVTTESLAAVNWGREQRYKSREGWQDDQYKWHVRNDRRTSPQCLEIQRRLFQNGGTMGLLELKNLIDEVAKKFDSKWQTRDWVPHYNCRSLLLRSVV